MARILSGKAVSGRPGFKLFKRGPQRGKSSVKRVHIDDPADGLLNADFSDNEDIVGNPSPTVLNGTQRLTSGPSTAGKIAVRDNSVDRSVNVR